MDSNFQEMLDQYYKLDEKFIPRFKRVKMSVNNGKYKEGIRHLTSFVNRNNILADRDEDTIDQDIEVLFYSGLEMEFSPGLRGVFVSFAQDNIFLNQHEGLYDSLKNGFDRLVDNNLASPLEKSDYTKAIYFENKDEIAAAVEVNYVQSHFVKLKAKNETPFYLSELRKRYNKDITVQKHDDNFKKMFADPNPSEYEKEFTGFVEFSHLLDSVTVKNKTSQVRNLMKNSSYETDDINQYMYIRMTQIALEDPQLYMDLSHSMQDEYFKEFFVTEDGRDLSNYITPILPPKSEEVYVLKNPPKEMEALFYSVTCELKHAQKKLYRNDEKAIFDFAVDDICERAREVFEITGLFPFVARPQNLTKEEKMLSNIDILNLASVIDVALLPDKQVSFSFNLTELVDKHPDVLTFFYDGQDTYNKRKKLFEETAEKITLENVADRYINNLVKKNVIGLPKLK